MKKLNKYGFTLIELLAVITIMGILILVAIPTISRTIENSRKDTFIDTAKQYVSGAKNMWVSDDLTCSVDGFTYAPSAVPAGAYYIPVDTSNSSHSLLLEQGGKSSWGKRDVKGYILVYIEEDAGNRKISYYPVLVDGVHGVNASDALTLSDKIVRGDLQMSGADYDSVDTSSGVSVTIDEKELTAAVCNVPQNNSSEGGSSDGGSTSGGNGQPDVEEVLVLEFPDDPLYFNYYYVGVSESNGKQYAIKFNRDGSSDYMENGQRMSYPASTLIYESNMITENDYNSGFGSSWDENGSYSTVTHFYISDDKKRVQGVQLDVIFEVNPTFTGA